MYRSSRPITHRPERDGSAVAYDHVPAYLALEMASEAWSDALTHACGEILQAVDVMIVNITSNFSRELLVGIADFDVTVTKIGRTSLVLEVVIAQRGEQSTHAVFTVARVVEGRSQPLTDEQRAALLALAPDSGAD